MKTDQDNRSDPARQRPDDTVHSRHLLLVMPPQPGLLEGFSAGLLAIANHVSQALPHIEVRVVDLGRAIASDLPKLVSEALGGTSGQVFVGITATTASYQAGLDTARELRRQRPNAVLFMGGPHVSGDAEMVARHHSDLLDFVITGEGEKATVDVLMSYPNLGKVRGATYLSGRAVRSNLEASPLTEGELDSLPVGFGEERFIGSPGKFHHVTYVSARGCPLRCAFCSVANQRIRAKTIPAVVRDIHELLDLGYRRLAIEDNFFAHSANRTREICEALIALREESGVDFNWDCQTRVESLCRPGLIPLLARAGCDAVYVGVESLNHDQLLYLGKASRPENYLAMLRETVLPQLLVSNLSCYLNLQLGLPGESEHHCRQTIRILGDIGRMALRRGREITVFPQLHVVYPGTAHFEQGVEEGRFSLDVFENFTAWEVHQKPVLFWLGEHFAHGTGGLPEGILYAESLRIGVFEPRSDAICAVSATLRAIDRLAGVRVFRYGDYLVAPEHWQTASERTSSLPIHI